MSGDFASFPTCTELMPSLGCGLTSSGFILYQWFPTFLMLQPFNKAAHVVVTPRHKIIFVVVS